MLQPLPIIRQANATIVKNYHYFGQHQSVGIDRCLALKALKFIYVCKHCSFTRFAAIKNIHVLWV